MTKLIGCKIFALIGEPWDFSSSTGENKLSGSIIAASPDVACPWLLCNADTFTMNKTTISQVIITPRQRLKDQFYDNLRSVEGVSSNLGYLADGKLIDPDQVVSILTKTLPYVGFLIGNVRIQY